ncbi:hypothetical protein FE257_004580 [Aspergillus nanangensis]|uniref:DUF6536 domain-containing protein n=1 Tax=Aspergillus nanangensis TaxID=2582783 RepID=A0AAD4H0Q3_ASPNN|nr:hypothetical protein FE257_004580 [Aspergillus nanangensis]
MFGFRSGQSAGPWPKLQAAFSRSGYRGVGNQTVDGTELHQIHRAPSTRPADETFLTTTQAQRDGSSDTDPIQNVTPEGSKAQWIKGVYICATISAVVLLINIILVSVAGGLAAKNPRNVGFSATQVVYEGDCALTERWDTGLHLLINCLSTAILAASNFCMQSLVAPSREEVDQYHARRKWLDIGVPSVRNLFAVGRYRVNLWFVLLFTATPFHLLYNSAIFASVVKSGFAIIVAPRDLDSSTISSLRTPELEDCFYGFVGYDWDNFAAFIANGTYKQHSREECIELSNDKSPSTIRTIVVRTDSLNSTQGGNMAIFQSNMDVTPSNELRSEGIDPNLLYGSRMSETTWAFTVNNEVTYDTLNYSSLDCSDQIQDSNNACSDATQLSSWLWSTQPQSMDVVDSYISSNLSPDITAHVKDQICLYNEYFWTNTLPIGDCLVIPRNGQCQLFYNPPISIVVIITAAIKVAAMFFAAKVDRNRSAPLLTVGDAVASFITKPDPTTTGMCWMSNSDMERVWGSTPVSGPSQTALIHHSNTITHTELKPGHLTRSQLWWRAASIPRWIITLALCAICIIVGAYLLGQSGSGSGARTTSIKSWWQLGFGTPTGSVVLQQAKQWPILGYVVVANTPQFIITISYYFYNNVLTSMVAAAEYHSYGSTRRTLRVSWPRPDSSQRSTYWLSVPYQYSIPVLAIYAALHWTISQSLFYVQIVPYDLFGGHVDDQELRGLGYSPIAIFVSLLLGGVLVGSFLLVAVCRRLGSLIPLAGSSSAGISASCHPGVDVDASTVALGEVAWGETAALPEWMVGDGGDVAHCSFTSGEVLKPSLEKLYA